MRKNILLILLLAGSIFLFAPISKVEASSIYATNLVTGQCKSFTNNVSGSNQALAWCGEYCKDACCDFDIGGDGCPATPAAPRDCATVSGARCPEVYDFSCTVRGGGCSIIKATDQDDADKKCAATCELSAGGSCISKTLAAPGSTCPEPKEYGCTKNGKCENIEAVDYESASGQCNARCGADDGIAQTGTCTPSTEPCRISPLEGATPEALKKAASSDLNKAGFKTPTDLINRAIKLLMAFIGSIALVLYIVSGLLWMTASGNAERVTKAKTTMVWTTLGVLMMLASYMLASFLFKSLGV